MSDFNQFLKVLRRETPDYPVLFELFMNRPLYEYALQKAGKSFDNSDYYSTMVSTAYAFEALGYDYATVHGLMRFETGNSQHGDTISLNDGTMITDRESFERYQWPDPYSYDYSAFDKIKSDMSNGMKLMIMGPGGVLENVISLMGFDNMCLALYDDEQLVWDVFEQVGKRLVGYYKEALKYESVGVVMSNDDWGFNTQTMISIENMQKYTFPWHTEIVKTAHSSGRPVLLHSCGNFSKIIPDLIDLKYDARHSYEDNIIPVEQAYDMLIGNMAVLGGMDVDFLIRSEVGDIRTRVTDMLNKTGGKGYAVGSGNSVPEYIPLEKYYAMIDAAKSIRL